MHQSRLTWKAKKHKLKAASAAFFIILHCKHDSHHKKLPAHSLNLGKFTTMKDIENRADLEILLKEFYTRLLKDNTINYIFIDVAKINLETHLPHLADFWEQSLFYTGGYKKNVLQIHLDLNDKEPFTEEHFKTWLSHFNQTIDDLFSGLNAEKIKTRAESIATVMKLKLSGH